MNELNHFPSLGNSWPDTSDAKTLREAIGEFFAGLPFESGSLSLCICDQKQVEGALQHLLLRPSFAGNYETQIALGLRGIATYVGENVLTLTADCSKEQASAAVFEWARRLNPKSSYGLLVTAYGETQFTPSPKKEKLTEEGVAGLLLCCQEP